MLIGLSIWHGMQKKILMLCAVGASALLHIQTGAVAGAASRDAQSYTSINDSLFAQADSTPPPTQLAPETAPPAPQFLPQTPLTQAKPPAASAAPSNGTPAVVLDGQQVESILGKKVRSAGGDDMGRIVDIIGDKTGQVRAAIIDFGGFLGVGSRQIAVGWKALRFPIDGKSDAVVVDLNRDQLRVAPAYKAGEQIVVLGGRPTAGDAQGSAITIPPAQDAAEPSKPAPSK